MWQLLAIVAIAVSTMLWFVRDQRRRKARALQAKAHYFAKAPRHRPVAIALPVSIPNPPRRVAGLRHADRAFFEQMIRDKAPR